MKPENSSGIRSRRSDLLARFCLLCAAILLVFSSNGAAAAKEPAFKVLAFYSTDVEPDHVHTANDALAFFRELAAKNNFIIDATTDWGKLNEDDLKPYQLILWLNNFPQTPEQRAAFEKYMEHGGGWLGFHVAGYNDETTKWPWFVDFMGGAVFYANNWPPLPAKLAIQQLTVGLRHRSCQPLVQVLQPSWPTARFLP